MREIDGKIYYTAGDVSAYIGRSRQTIVAWDILSDYVEQEKGIRFTPKPIKINQQRLYTKDQVREIKRFADSKKNGVLAKAKKEYEEKRNAETKPKRKQSWPAEGRSIR